MNFNSYTSFHILTLIQDPQNSNHKRIRKLLEENTGESLHKLEEGKHFLKYKNYYSLKNKVDKFDFVNIKIFCL